MRRTDRMRLKTGDPNVAADTNVVEFNAQALGPLLNGFGSHLSGGFLSSFRPHVIATIAGVERHKVPVTYTNMYLTKMVNLILLGQYAGDAGAVRQGEEMISEWIRYTRSYGITEFDSPTYYKTDINSLVEGYRYASNRNDRRVFAVMLDYIWTDIAANYMPSADKLTGPTSRGYDLLRGVGGSDGWIEAAGWSPIYRWPFVTEQVFLYDNQRPGGYWPSESIHRLAYNYPREVTSSRDDVPTHTRWNWVSGHVAIGCTSGDVHGNDTTFSGVFVGPPLTTPLVSVMVDAIDSPYGLVLRRPVPYHQASAPGCVQKGGAVLLTMDLDPHVKRGARWEFTTNILLPKAAVIEQDGQRLSLAVPGNIPINPRALISATLNGGTIAMRFIRIDPVNGKSPVMTLSANALGLKRGAVRLKITHLHAGEATAARDLRIATLLIADERPAAALIDEMRGANFVDKIRGDTWDVAAHVPGTSLRVQRSVSDRKTIFDQEVDGRTVPRPVLSVNGKDLASPVWSKLP